MMPIQPNHHQCSPGKVGSPNSANSRTKRVESTMDVVGTTLLGQFRCHSQHLDDDPNLTSRNLLAAEEDDNVSGMSSASSASSASALDRANVDSRKISRKRNDSSKGKTKGIAEDELQYVKRSKLDDNRFSMSDRTIPHLLSSQRRSQQDDPKEAVKRENNRRNAARSRSRNKVMVRELKQRVEELTVFAQNLQRANTLLLSQLGMLRLQQAQSQISQQSQQSQVATASSLLLPSSSSLFPSSLLASSQHQDPMQQQQSNTNLFSSALGVPKDVPTTGLEALGRTITATSLNIAPKQQQQPLRVYDQQPPIGNDVFDYIHRQLGQQTQHQPFGQPPSQLTKLPPFVNQNPSIVPGLQPDSSALIQQLLGFNRPPSSIQPPAPPGGLLSEVTNITHPTDNTIIPEALTTTTAGQLVGAGKDTRNSNASILQQILDAMATISSSSGMP